MEKKIVSSIEFFKRYTFLEKELVILIPSLKKLIA